MLRLSLQRQRYPAGCGRPVLSAATLLKRNVQVGPLAARIRLWASTP